MPARVGWRCRACTHYVQPAVAREAPDRCPHCGAVGSLRRIDHRRVPAGVAVGDTVVCDVVGTVHQVVVGDVVAVGEDRVAVEARDGTGVYTVTPEQIVRKRA